MNIVRLKILNFMSIIDVDIHPSQVNQIVGQNNNGKTTILKALEWAIKGKPDASLIRRGEESAEVIVELDDETIIKRRINAKGMQSVDVRRGEFKTTSPQAHLDALFDSTAFNPLDLLDPKKRNDAIMQALEFKVTAEQIAQELSCPIDRLPAGINYGEHGLKVIDQLYKGFYQRRAEANKEAEEKKKRWQTYHNDLPQDAERPLMHDEILSKIETINDQKVMANRVLEKALAEIEVIKKQDERLDKLKKEILALDSQREIMESAHKEAVARVKSKREYILNEIDDLKVKTPKESPDTTAIRESCTNLQIQEGELKAKMKEADAYVAVQKQRVMVDDMHAQFLKAEKIAGELKKRVDILAGPLREKLMAGIEMPIKGLSFADGQFVVDGIPVDNLSSSLALKLAIGVARKIAKKNKVICIDGAEMLDEKTWADFRKEIDNDGFVYFITKVGGCFVGLNDSVIPMSNGQVIQ